MGRGRPKGSKNKPKINLFQTIETTSNESQKIEQSIIENQAENKEEVKTNIDTPENETPVKTKARPIKTYGICNKCNTPIYMSPVSINLSHLTSKATWHRRCKLERIELCNSCAAELNTLIDNWILKDHPEYVKWDISEKEF